MSTSHHENVFRIIVLACSFSALRIISLCTVLRSQNSAWVSSSTVLSALFLQIVSQQCVTWSAEVHEEGICPIRALTWSKPSTFPAVLSVCTVPQNSKMGNSWCLWGMTVSGSLIGVMDTALTGSTLHWFFAPFLLFAFLGSTSWITAIGSPAFPSQL